MPKPQNPFADIPPITDFESSQRVRGLLLQRLGDLFGVWEGCEDRACTRARSCQRKDAACLSAFMQAMPDEDRRELQQALLNRGQGQDGAAGPARAR